MKFFKSFLFYVCITKLIVNMETNYTPGQILYIQSTENYFYLSVMRSMQQHPVVNDANRREINTCCDLCVDVYSGEMYPSEITFARGGNASTWDLDVEFDEIRPAHDFEKKLLYDRLVEKFKLYDPVWNRSFTDSTYDDIRDWLCWAFDVDLDNMDNNNPLGVTIYEITNYIWNTLCKETGNYQEKAVEPEMVNKQEFIAKVKMWLELETNWNKEYIRDEVAFCDWYRDIRNPNYGKIDELIKFLEA